MFKSESHGRGWNPAPTSGKTGLFVGSGFHARPPEHGLSLHLPNSILVLAPHPDDEILMAAGIIRRALKQSARISVCIVTNGDHMCADTSKGVRRLGESLDALRLLGMDERNIYFLGYPDTGFEPENSFLARLFDEKDRLMVYPSACGNETYGLGSKPDLRYAHSGRHSPYCKAAFIKDLIYVIRLASPELIITSSQWDAHGDHMALYRFTHDIVSAMPNRISLWESLIHSKAGDDCWPLPNGDDFTRPPGFPEMLWQTRIRVPMPEDMLSGFQEEHMKYRAILAHRSALNFETEPEVAKYLLSFAKAEEIFWETVL